MLFNSNSKYSTSNFWWCCKILKRALVADHVSVFYRSANGHRSCNGDHFLLEWFAHFKYSIKHV